MKKEKENGVLGPLGKELLETRPIGGRIPKEKYREWQIFKNRCYIAGVKPNPDGLLDMLETYNKINSVIFSLARVYGFKPLPFKDEILTIMLNSLNELNEQKELKQEAFQLKKNLHNKIATTVTMKQVTQ